MAKILYLLFTFMSTRKREKQCILFSIEVSGLLDSLSVIVFVTFSG